MNDLNEEMDRGTESVFHERVNLLKDQGYRGFRVARGQERVGGVQVTVTNQKGRTLSAQGESMDEAYENMIELIDHLLDD
mgnify:CR=1 FL=1